MRTALITSGEKQQVVLQPENTREHRILQMLLDGEKEVTVMQSTVSVDGHGNITAVQRAQFYDEHKAHPMPVMVQVQPAAPVQRDLSVIVVRKETLQELLRRIHNMRQGLDPMAEDANTRSRAKADYDELIGSLEGFVEPNPYL